MTLTSLVGASPRGVHRRTADERRRKQLLLGAPAMATLHSSFLLPSQLGSDFLHRSLALHHSPPSLSARASSSAAQCSLELVPRVQAEEKRGTTGSVFPFFGGGRRAAEERRLLEALSEIRGRGRGAAREQLQEVQDAIEALESLSGQQNPVYSKQIEGSWKLLFTTRPGTASPIQRTFVGVDAFSVYQQIALSGSPEEQRVSNIVVFGDKIGRLKVEAEASAASGERIDFRFDRAAFELAFWPYRVPYPVPFRLLGDEAKGWLDTTYLSPNGLLRVSKGNKGTTFVLQKYFTPQELLLQAIQRGTGVDKAIDDVIATNSTRAPARSPLSSGVWRLLWTSQASTASKIETFSTGLAKNYQVVDGESKRLETIVEFLPGVVLRAGASTEVASASVTDIEIDSAALCIGPITIPVGIRGTGNVDILYVDDNLRISRGNKGSMYVQRRERNPPEWI